MLHVDGLQSTAVIRHINGIKIVRIAGTKSIDCRMWNNSFVFAFEKAYYNGRRRYLGTVLLEQGNILN